MEIERFEWRAENVDKLLAHGVASEEADELLSLDSWVTATHDDYPDQVRVIGQTRSGRFLTIAVDPTDSPLVWRPITGWPAGDREIAYYLNQMFRLTRQR